jgi:hypothetical protein
VHFNKSKKKEDITVSPIWNNNITIKYYCSIIGKEKPRVFTLEPTFIIVHVAFACGR